MYPKPKKSFNELILQTQASISTVSSLATTAQTETTQASISTAPSLATTAQTETVSASVESIDEPSVVIEGTLRNKKNYVIIGATMPRRNGDIHWPEIFKWYKMCYRIWMSHC